MPRFDEIQTAMGTRLRARRNELRLSQQQLADKAGIKRGNVAQYETGRNSIPAWELWQLSKALSCPVDFFFGEKDQLPGWFDLKTSVAIKELPAEERRNILRTIVENASQETTDMLLARWAEAAGGTIIFAGNHDLETSDTLRRDMAPYVTEVQAVERPSSANSTSLAAAKPEEGNQ